MERKEVVDLMMSHPLLYFKQRYKTFVLTIFTITSIIARNTATFVFIDQIFTTAAILARVARTFVDIY